MDHKLKAAYAAVDEQDYPRALQFLQRYLRHARYDGRGWELCGLVLSALQRHAASVSALERASLLVPLRMTARICLAIGYGRIGRGELSKELLAAMIADDNMTVEQLLQVAQGLDAVDAPHLAIQACRQAVRHDPALAQPYYDLGYYSARCGRPVEITVALARKAISLDPVNVVYRIGLSSLLVSLTRYDEAYQIVRHLTNEQIEMITCQCCLERMIWLFEDSQDFRRAVLGRRQMLKLAAQTGSSSTDKKLA